MHNIKSALGEASQKPCPCHRHHIIVHPFVQSTCIMNDKLQLEQFNPAYGFPQYTVTWRNQHFSSTLLSIVMSSRPPNRKAFADNKIYRRQNILHVLMRWVLLWACRHIHTKSWHFIDIELMLMCLFLLYSLLDDLFGSSENHPFALTATISHQINDCCHRCRTHVKVYRTENHPVPPSKASTNNHAKISCFGFSVFIQTTHFGDILCDMEAGITMCCGLQSSIRESGIRLDRGWLVNPNWWKWTWKTFANFFLLLGVGVCHG